MNLFQAIICCFLFIGTTGFSQSGDSIESHARSLPWNSHVPEVHYTPEFTPNTPGLLITIIVRRNDEILTRSFYGIVFSERFYNTTISSFWSSGMSARGSSKGSLGLFGSSIKKLSKNGFVIFVAAGFMRADIPCEWKEDQNLEIDGYNIKIQVEKNTTEQGAAANP